MSPKLQKLWKSVEAASSRFAVNTVQIRCYYYGGFVSRVYCCTHCAVSAPSQLDTISVHNEPSLRVNAKRKEIDETTDVQKYKSMMLKSILIAQRVSEIPW